MEGPTATDNSANTGAWVCLGLAWLMFLLPIPGAGLFLGWPLNLVAFVLAIVVIAQGRTAPGVTVLLLSMVASPLVYFLGLVFFLGAIAALDNLGHLAPH